MARVARPSLAGGAHFFLENPGAGVGRRRRFSPMELQLSQLQGLSRGHLRARARTQSSIAVAGRRSWALVNASPDVLAQLQSNPDLQPGRAVRDTAIAAIVLVDGQVDHTTGLYMLRESVRPGPSGAPTAPLRT